jgi:hypothetical protein
VQILMNALIKLESVIMDGIATIRTYVLYVSLLCHQFLPTIIMYFLKCPTASAFYMCVELVPAMSWYSSMIPSSSMPSLQPFEIH